MKKLSIKTNCSVTVMPVYKEKIGFIKRDINDTFGGKLVAPGGKVELNDGTLIDNVPYFSVEEAAKRELSEETDIKCSISDFHYLCSLTLPHNGRVVISFYCFINNPSSQLYFLSEKEVRNMNKTEFAPGMKKESLLLFERIKK